MSLRSQAIQIYNAAKPRKEVLGKAWRKTVIYEMVEQLSITEASAAAHFNVAKLKDNSNAASDGLGTSSNKKAVQVEG